MPDDTNIADRFKKQTYRRAKWLLFSATMGTIAALIFETVERGAYPAWKVGVLVAGVLLFPFLLKDERKKDYVSRWTAIREIKRLLQK